MCLCVVCWTCENKIRLSYWRSPLQNVCEDIVSSILESIRVHCSNGTTTANACWQCLVSRLKIKPKKETGDGRINWIFARASRALPPKRTNEPLHTQCQRKLFFSVSRRFRSSWPCQNCWMEWHGTCLLWFVCSFHIFGMARCRRYPRRLSVEYVFVVHVRTVWWALARSAMCRFGISYIYFNFMLRFGLRSNVSHLLKCE